MGSGSAFPLGNRTTQGPLVSVVLGRVEKEPPQRNYPVKNRLRKDKRHDEKVSNSRNSRRYGNGRRESTTHPFFGCRHRIPSDRYDTARDEGARDEHRRGFGETSERRIRDNVPSVHLREPQAQTRGVRLTS